MTWSSRRTAAFFYICVVVNIFGQAAQNLASPLWWNALPEKSCRDAFVTYLIMILWYPVMFLLTSVGCRLVKRDKAKNGSLFSFLWKYSFRQHVTICFTGLSDALNGALVIPTTPSDRTPAIVASLIGSTTLLPMIFFKHFYFHVARLHGFNVYNNRLFIMSVLAYICASYTIVYPVFYFDDKGVNAEVWWWLIFFVGSVFGQIYNVQQEHSFKKWNHNSFIEYVDYLFWQTFYLLLWGYALVWMDVIPSFGYAAKHGLQCSFTDTFYDSFRGEALLWNFVFNIAYYVSYIASCFINQEDALIGTVSGVAVTAVVTAIAYPISDLTPDKNVVMIGLVPLTILLTALSTYLYSAWVKDKNPYPVSNTNDHGKSIAECSPLIDNNA